MENENQVAVAAENENQVMTMEGNENFIMDLTESRSISYTSLKAGTIEEKKKFYNAVNSTDKRIGDCINQTINLKDVYCEVVTCTNKETGEQTQCPRVVLIDDKGVSYQAVSLGVFNGLRKIFQIFGQPTYAEPLPIKVKQITKGERKILTFEF